MEFRCSRLRAIQDLNYVQETNNTCTEFSSFFRIELSKTNKRKLNPWILELSLQKVLGNKPKKIRSCSDNAYVVQVNTKEESNRILKLKQIENIPVEKVAEHPSFNCSKGLAFIYNYDLTDFNKFRSQFLQDTGHRNIEQATWIKPRNENAKPVLISFNQNIPPQYVDIPGEIARTKILPFTPQPMMCKNCYQYGHTKKHCNQATVCKHCSETEHQTEKCTNDLKCLHCGGAHDAGNKSCPKHKYETDVLSIQSTEQVTISEARRLYNTRHGPFKIHNAQYSEVVKNSKRTTNGINIKNHKKQDILQIMEEMDTQEHIERLKRKRNHQEHEESVPRLVLIKTTTMMYNLIPNVLIIVRNKLARTIWSVLKIKTGNEKLTN